MDGWWCFVCSFFDVLGLVYIYHYYLSCSSAKKAGVQLDF